MFTCFHLNLGGNMKKFFQSGIIIDDMGVQEWVVKWVKIRLFFRPYFIVENFIVLMDWKRIVNWFEARLFPLNRLSKTLQQIGFILPIYLQRIDDEGVDLCTCSDGRRLRFSADSKIEVWDSKKCLIYEYSKFRHTIKLINEFVEANGKWLYVDYNYDNLCRFVTCTFGDYTISIKCPISFGIFTVNAYLLNLTVIPTAKDIWNDCIKKVPTVAVNDITVEISVSTNFFVSRKGIVRERPPKDGMGITSPIMYPISEIAVHSGSIVRDFEAREGDIHYAPTEYGGVHKIFY